LRAYVKAVSTKGLREAAPEEGLDYGELIISLGERKTCCIVGEHDSGIDIKEIMYFLTPAIE
jgi:hypothetical protein